MPRSIAIKKSSVAGKVPLAGDLEIAELAVNLADRLLYTKDAGGTVFALGTPASHTHTWANISDAPAFSSSASNGTIVQRNGSGYIYANYYNTSPNDVSSGITRICCETGNDGFIRHATAAAVQAFIGLDNYLPIGGKAADSQKLDGVDSSQFLRSDVADIKTGGYTRYNTEIELYFGSSADTAVFHGGSHFYLQNATGNLYIQQKTHGGNIVLQAENSGGTNRAAAYFAAADQRLYAEGSEKLRTTTTGVTVYGTLDANRIACGYDPGYNGGIGCTHWIRSVGNVGWYSQTHGGGIYMVDTTWVRTYNAKGFYTGSGHLRTDGQLQVGYNDVTLEHNSSDSVFTNHTGHSFWKNSASYAYHYFQCADSTGATRAAAYFSASYQRLFTNGTEKLRTTSTGVTVYGSVAESSSRELKDVSGAVRDALGAIARLEPVVYSLKADESKVPQIGLIAEDVPDDLMVANKGGEPEERNVSYARLSVWAIAAIQELKKRVERLEAN